MHKVMKLCCKEDREGFIIEKKGVIRNIKTKRERESSSESKRDEWRGRQTKRDQERKTSAPPGLNLTQMWALCFT